MSTTINGETLETYEEDGRRYVVAPCGCPDCATAVQPGHFACDAWPEALRTAYAARTVDIVYEDQWRWIVA